MDGTWLLLSGLFSLVGIAVFMYGRRAQLIAPTVVGACLMAYEYFVNSYVALIGIGVALLVLLFVGMRIED